MTVPPVHRWAATAHTARSTSWILWQKALCQPMACCRCLEDQQAGRQAGRTGGEYACLGSQIHRAFPLPICLSVSSGGRLDSATGFPWISPVCVCVRLSSLTRCGRIRLRGACQPEDGQDQRCIRFRSFGACCVVSNGGGCSVSTFCDV